MPLLDSAADFALLQDIAGFWWHHNRFIFYRRASSVYVFQNVVVVMA